jgi:hypothetical protein
MVIGEDGWEAVHSPELAVDLVHDATGKPFCLMYGPEPDLRWNAFTQAVGDIAAELGVREAVGMHGVPAPVPHTRSLRVTAPGVGAIAMGAGGPRSKVRLPGSAQALLEYRLGEQGLDSKTVLVHVPHYLAAMPYPAGTVALLERIADVVPLTFDLTRLAAAAEQTDREISRQVEDSDDLREMIADLERRYDERLAAGPLALPGEPLPDAEAIAAELEAFLAEQADGTDSEL